ncbi:CaiB/BaiF CoA-transferase family protein [Novosphingobium sp. BW1]|uniref:CaiB/BaiF CoA transferase family protein n=1 Tax=Novosphingobium sp. BW1 TaxID=2592621 RepID=UPI0011DEDF60|nr:CoA transferase [Novosphingobium sp. BW1]TYC90449.1 CoA transferase [Novosphingobium sp. BW1]
MTILKDIRVLDCSIAMAGPFAAQRLGDMGADVVKVEPTSGEWQRHASAGGAQGNRINVSFLSLNRNKRSLAIDLKSPEGKAVLLDLVKNADVFLQNYRPGVAERLGVDYATLSAINPRLIYVSMSGYGEDGPYRNLPGQDLLLQGMSGAMLSTGVEGTPPSPAGQYLVDAVAAYNAFEGALAALFHRERTGEGQLVQVNMLDAITTIQMQELSVFTVGHKPQSRSAEPHAHSYIRAPYGVFATSDGYMTLAMAPLKALARELDDPFFAELEEERDGWTQRDAIFARVREHLVTASTQHWLAKFRQADIWCGPVYGYADLLEDPQIKHNGTFVEYEHPTEGRVKVPGFPIRFSATPCAITRGAPLVGEHSHDVLAETGRSEQEIAKLIESGVVRQHA